MTYFGFLLRFLGIPIAGLLAVWLFTALRNRSIPGFRGGRAVWVAILLHVVIAVVYTTPWDNYLVATGVWYYNPDLISGVLLGWVPVEEYTFFVLETILVGLWWWVLAVRITGSDSFRPRVALRLGSVVLLGVIWLWSFYLFVSGGDAWTYLGLILVWGLPPILLQLAFGADILWHHRKLVLLVILPVFVYLIAADALAISAGTWTIDPEQSTSVFIGPLPIEEAVFFLITVVLIGFGLTLALARVSQERLLGWVRRVFRSEPKARLQKKPAEE